MKVNRNETVANTGEREKSSKSIEINFHADKYQIFRLPSGL